MDRILIYTKEISARALYLFREVFEEALGLSVNVVDAEDRYWNEEGPKIYYSSSAPTSMSGIYFSAVSILFSRAIEAMDVEVGTYKQVPVLFPVADSQSQLPYDPFAAIFYMLSRYEEYLPYNKDVHGRFPATESMAFRHGFLNKPVVDIWIRHIKAVLQAHYPELVFRSSSFHYTPTYDIDIAYAFKGRGVARILWGIFKDFSTLNFSNFLLRMKVLLGKERDPYDTYSFQWQLHERYNLKPYYFMLLGNRGKYDHNLSTTNGFFRKLILDLSQHGEVGIHPSYASNDDGALLPQEIERLSKVTRRKISCSRQHFLKLSIPQTYRRLIAEGITSDFSMGFADEPGFRAGTSRPFYFFDLAQNSESELKVYPLTVMEGTLRDYKKCSANEAKQILFHLIREVKSVDGAFVSLWHNTSLQEDVNGMDSWKGIYEEMIDYIFSTVADD